MTIDRAFSTIKRDRAKLLERGQMAAAILSARIAANLDDIEAEIAIDALCRYRAANQLAREAIAALS
jgi:hypothetical protein